MANVKDVKCVTTEARDSYSIILSMRGELYLIGTTPVTNVEALPEPVKYLDNIGEIVVLGYDGKYSAMISKEHDVDGSAYGRMNFDVIEIYYQGQNITKDLKALRIFERQIFCLTASGDLIFIDHSASEEEVIDNDVILFYVAVFEEHDRLSYAKSEVLYTPNQELKWGTFCIGLKNS